MLNGISPLLGPDLLATLCRMGHGDTIVLADAHFPGESVGRRVLRCDGVAIPPLLDAILPLFPLDGYIDAPLAIMAPVPGDIPDPRVEASYRALAARHQPDRAHFTALERFAFYERARDAFAVVMTGDTAKYANLLLTKGVCAPPAG
ncbi:MAG: L-fucose mutarotase [Planctomycetes bacterium]|nr:L-fucose mutarotase [Planctomycetota bacterium]